MNRVVPARVRCRPGAPDPHGPPAAIDGHVPERFAALVLDIDDFCEVNDALGHVAGDTVLEHVGSRLGRLGGPPVRFTRLSGDAFAALVPRPPERPGADQPLEIAARALRAIRRPLVIDDIEIALSASAGIALYPEHARDSHGLMRLADVAMRQARRQRLSVALYRRGMERHSRRRLALAGEFRNAIDRDEIVVQYQPQIDPSTQTVAGVEALVRWQRGDGTVLSPKDFLPIAERYGLMPELTSRVLHAVAAQQARWLAQGLRLPVAINLSTSDLHDRTLPARIAATLGAAGVPPDLLHVEVTEHLLMSDPDGANTVLEELRGMGVRVALDDFGTGHSSLAYVQRLALDVLKIDRRFVSGMCESEGDATIVRLAVELAHAFGLEVVAEGVKSRACAAALRALGCDAIQGFWVSPPLWADDLQPWIAQQEPERWAA